MRCPKCSSLNAETYHDNTTARPWATGIQRGHKQGDRILHCPVCGLLLYGEAADKVVEALRAAVPLREESLPVPMSSVVKGPAVTPSDLRWAHELRDEAEVLRGKVQAARGPTGSRDRAFNLAMVNTGRVIGLTVQVPQIRTVNEKRRIFDLIDSLLEPVYECLTRGTGVPHAPRVRPPDTAPAAVPVTRVEPPVATVLALRPRFIKEPPPPRPQKPTKPPPSLKLIAPMPGDDPNPDAPGQCAWGPCQEQARGTSVYCSTNCRNRNARLMYKERRDEQAAGRASVRAPRATPEPVVQEPFKAPPPPPPPPPRVRESPMSQAIRKFRTANAVPEVHAAQVSSA